MSVLTKVFVVLLVVLSLLLSAAAVTFLNTIPGLQASVETTRESLRLAQAEAARSQSAAEFARSNAERTVSSLQQRLSEAQRAAEQAQADLDEARADAARIQGQLALEQATVASNAQAVSVTVQQYQQLQDQLAQLRQQSQQVSEQYGATQAQLNRVQNELTYAERALRGERERNAELLSQSEQKDRALARLGVEDTANLPANLVAANVNGVITDKQNLANGPYASISIGREDNVVAGMQLAVFDDVSQNFLGVLTVESVDDQQAYGSLRGDNVAQIAAQDIVRTAN